MPELKARGNAPSIWFETRGNSSKPPLLLLHGFTQTHRTWDALADRLDKRSFVVLPDLPGHGRSGVSESKAGMGVGRTAESIVDVMRLASGMERAAVLGYSLGGRVALELACRRQELVSSLVLEGASPGIEAEPEREERRKSDDALADDIEKNGLEWFVEKWEKNPVFATQKVLPRDVAEEVRRDRLSNSAHGLAMSLRSAGTGAMEPLWAALSGLRVPVLIVVGEKDPKFTKAGEAMHRRIPGSLLVKVEGAGHCVHIEKPDEFADLVEQFLTDRAAVARGVLR